MKNLGSIRREYGKVALNENEVSPSPFIQFEQWFNDALAHVSDPNAMVLATVDENGDPDTRVVLLKEISDAGLVFFTNYLSPKVKQAEGKGKVALNFYWHQLAKQIRIKGTVTRTSREESETYFATRPRESQLSAWASLQSHTVTREELENKLKTLTDQFEGKPIPCPETWGGIRVIPFEFEFFQGRDNRLNDRILYKKLDEKWVISRLSP